MKKTAPRQDWEKTAEEVGPHGSFGHAAMKMRRFSVFLFGILCALLVLSACSATADAAAFSGGSGTETDPYLISTAKDLWELADKINTEETLKEYTGAFYRLTNDIDLGGKKKWTPIGNYSVNTYLWFEGTFDGGGHTIQGIRINYKDPLLGKKQSLFGLFGRLEGTVKDLTISNSSIAAEGESSIQVGAIAGDVRGGVLMNCHTTDSVSVSSSYYVGGICGHADGDSTLSNCSNAASVTAAGTVSKAGGITPDAFCHVEACSNSGSVVSREADAAGIAVSARSGISDCENTGDVTAEDYAAGIVCHFDDGALNPSMNDDTVSLLRCTNSGKITSEKDTAGGIAVSCRTGSIVDCRNTGSVTSPKETGGIFAYFQPAVFGTPCELFTVSGCENSGAILSTANNTAGGICGRIHGGKTTRLLFENCVNSGTVEASGLTDVLVSAAYAGGIIGEGTVSALEVRSCRNLGSVRGYAASGGILGYVSPIREAEETSLLVQDCTNSGSIYTVYPGGLKQEIYAGGIVGDCRLETDDEELLPVFDDLRIENCKNTGKLDGDRDPDILCTDDICASRQSRIQWTDDSDGA